MLLLLLIVSCCVLAASANGQSYSIVPGIYSKKTVSNGLMLPATSTFSPITTLTTSFSLEKKYSVFIHYQFTFESIDQDLFSSLQLNNIDVGSLVHTGSNRYKTPTGFYMTTLGPGDYTVNVLYKSPVAINMPASWDWQTAVLQVMWFEDARVVSDGISCHPVPPSTNTYNIMNPLENLDVTLLLPNSRVILSAYQFSVDMSSPLYVVTALEFNGFNQLSSSFLQGNNDYLGLHGALAVQSPAGLHHLNILYRSPRAFTFTDCKYNYDGNTNLYAMMLPAICKTVSVAPITKFAFKQSNWVSTDLTYSLSLSKLSHVIIMYQFAGPNGGGFTLMRLMINSVVQPHTASTTGDTASYGTFGLWQGPLDRGTNVITIQYRNSKSTTSNVYYDVFHQWENRALTIIYC